MLMQNIRPYRTTDRAACLELFGGNRPKFFDASELPLFIDFLDNFSDEYFVLELEGVVVACGGWYHKAATSEARLCWGMVGYDLHKKGYGSELLTYRLREIAKNKAIQNILMDTSQHAVEFFQRFGFTVSDIKKDAYGPGLHRHDLKLSLNNRAV